MVKLLCPSQCFAVLQEYGILVNQFNIKVLWWQYGDAHWRALGPGLTPANLTHALCLVSNTLLAVTQHTVLSSN